MIGTTSVSRAVLLSFIAIWAHNLGSVAIIGHNMKLDFVTVDFGGLDESDMKMTVFRGVTWLDSIDARFSSTKHRFRKKFVSRFL